MTINTLLLRETLAWIETHREIWDQEQWTSTVQVSEHVCLTAHCFAGWAIALTYPDAKFVRGIVWLDGRIKQVPDFAAELLGISHLKDRRTWSGWHLFETTNSLDDLRRIVGELCDEEAA